MTSGLCNPEYYKGAFLEIQKSMEVREEGMEVQEEAAQSPTLGNFFLHLHTLLCHPVSFLKNTIFLIF